MAKNDPFDFSKARGSSGRTAFRTPMMSPTKMPKAIRPRFDSNSMSLGAVSPYRALAIYFAKLARAGLQGADEFSALNSAAARSATVARRVGAVERQAGFGAHEAQSILTDFAAKNPAGYSSKLFEEGVRQLFRPTEIDAILRSFAKLQGSAASRILGYGPQIIRSGIGTPSKVALGAHNAINAGRVLRGATRK